MTDSSLPAVAERFLRYVKIDTQSDASSDSVPSTEKQKNLGRLLQAELLEMGYVDVVMDEFGYVFCTVDAIRESDSYAEGESQEVVLSLLAHMDTAPDESGANVKPIVHPPYDGGAIELPGDPAVRLDPNRSPALLKHIGERIISSDGTTLLGSDDKAGIAILMQLVSDLRTDTAPRPKLKICFTIDEEIGRGVDHLDLDFLGADVAYTLDGSGINTLSFETFNAAMATIRVSGRSVHPGYAKGVLVNALRICADIISALPKSEAPETTEEREGYYHPYSMSTSDVTVAETRLILRDFTDAGMASRKRFVEDLVRGARKNHPDAEIKLEISDQYRNMRSYIENTDFRVVEFARQAAIKMGVDLEEELVRGGTDGARLSEKGLPTPNVFNGGYDYHSRFEWNTVENLEYSLEFTKQLVRYWGLHGTEHSTAT